MITEIKTTDSLKPAQGVNSPILYSQYWYSKHSNLNFVQDLNHFLFEGQILSTPDVFCMGKVVHLDNELVFFVRFAYGKMEKLKQHLPDYVRWIVFFRHNKGNLRKYSVERLAELSMIDSLTSPTSMEPLLETSRFRPAA